MLQHNGKQETELCRDNGFLCCDNDLEVLEKECRNIILLCRDNDQANGSRVLSQQSNLCCNIKSYRVKDFYHKKRKLCHDKNRKSNETSQDKFFTTKISMLQ